MVGQATSHRGHHSHLPGFAFALGLPSAAFPMRQAPVVKGADQPHACLSHLQAMRRMAATASQRGKAFSQSRMEALKKGSMENVASSRCLSHGQGLLEQALEQVSGDVYHAFFVPMFLDDPHEDRWPRFETSPPDPRGIGNVLSKCTSHAPQRGGEPVTADQERRKHEAASSHQRTRWSVSWWSRPLPPTTTGLAP